MNHIYRSIWNQATGNYVAVSEKVKSAGKRSLPGSSGGGGHFALTSMMAALMLGYGSLSLAGPTGGTVVGGQATINGASGATVINQGSQNAVINWASFNIGKGESVKFIQPNSNAVALNRVLGSDGTSILGNLSANGKVFIVNPNGILFGQGASVNTAGLVASTLDISDGDFMSGKYQFSGNGTGKVLNQGSISAPGGYVALLGAHVSNEGTIQARLGSVALVAGKAITLDVAGDGLLNVAVNEGAVGALVDNGGLIKADGGNVLLSAQAAGELLKTAVNNTGIIEAHSIDTKSGTIKLLGDMQSGTVNAAGTLDASAPDGGNGGFVDTSAAHVKLDNALKVTTAAAKGVAGTWLIDPTDYTIAASGGDQTGAFFSNALKSSNVQIQSISGGSGTAGDINVNDTISWAANKLTLTAQNNININKALRGSGTASLALEYGQSSVVSGNTATYNVKAEVDLPSGQNFSTRRGSDGTVVNYTVINALGAAGSTSGTDLQGINGGLGGNYVLGANIDATSTSGWNSGAGFASIGTNSSQFTGQFDGLGHVITGLTGGNVTKGSGFGLFGATSSTAQLRNIGIVAPSFNSVLPSGAYGYVGGLVGINAGTIDNAYVSGGTLKNGGLVYVGGLVGQNTGTISNSYNSAAIIANGNGAIAGGLVGLGAPNSKIISSYNAGSVTSDTQTAGGLVNDNRGTISDSYNTGNVTAALGAGGIAYQNRTTGPGIINNSFNTGAITGRGLVGGLVGYNWASAQINNSYSTGSVTAAATGGSGNPGYGGLVGDNRGAISNSYATGAVTGSNAVGGVVGISLSSGTVTNVYSSGVIGYIAGGTGPVGGIVGNSTSTMTVANAYYNVTLNPTLQVYGSKTNGTPATNATGLTSTEMRTASSFANFAFTTATGQSGNNWVIVDTDGTLNNAGGAAGATGPMLSSEYSTNIYSSHQLQLMAMNLAGNYKLIADINAGSTGGTSDVWNGATFIPVGTLSTAPFTGTLDGAGHTISGLVINRPSNNFTGLIGAMSGASSAVRNVGMEGGSVTGNDYTGALVGNNQGGTLSGNFSTVNVSAHNFVGGLVGNTTGTARNNYASGTVTGSDVVGGLAGGNAGTMINNYANGLVTGNTNTGGLLGVNFGLASGNFWDTTTSGKITSAAGTGLSTAQMKLLSTYSTPGWNLTDTWIIYDSYTTPLLRAFMTPLQVNFASNVSKTYDGTSSWSAPGVAYSNPNAMLSGSLNYGAAGTAVNAGTYAITADGLYSGQHGYAISANGATLTLDKRVATLSGAAVTTRDYNGTTGATITGGVLTGILSQDVSNVMFGTGAFDTKDAGVGKSVTALLTGSAGGNYTIAAPGLTGTITPKALTVSGLTATTRQYDGTNAASVVGGILTGLVGSETLNLGASSGVYADANAAAGKALTVTVGALSNGTGLASNYTVSAPTGVTGTITAKALSWNNLVVDNKVYDGTASAVISGGSLSGFVGGETLTSASSATFSDKNAANGKTATVQTTLGNGGGGGLASNYTIANTGVTADITPKQLTVSGVTAGSKVYDGTTAAAISGGVLSGMVGSETVGLGALSGTFAGKDAGTGKGVTVTGGTLSDGTNGGLASNYTVGSVTGLTADITQKALTVSGALVTSKTYDGSTLATVSGGTLTGLVGGETLVLSGLTGQFDNQNAGNGKAVAVSGASLADGSGLASNYTVSNPTGVTGTITPKALTVTGASGVTRVYDGTVAVSVTGGTLNGLVGSETLVLSGMSGVYGNKNADSGKAITVSGATLGDGTGLASNYTVSNPTTATGTVTKATISSISGLTAGSKTYDGTDTAVIGGTAVANGMVAGDNLAFGSASGQFSDKNAGTGKTVNITGITLTGSDLVNYDIASTNATASASIAQKALTISGATADSRIYDGTKAASITGGALSGMIGSEQIGLSGLTGVFADKNVGNGKLVTVNGATLTDGAGGGLASNYTVTSPSSLTANILRATISSVSNIAADTRAYNGNTAATVSTGGATYNGMVGGDSLSFTAIAAAFADKNAGTGKSVTVSGITLSGADAGNYILASTVGSGNGTITPKALTVTGVSVAGKVYDGNTTASLSGGGALNGLVGAETLALTGLSAVFDNQNAGNGKAVTVTGATLGDGTGGGLAANYMVSNPTGLTADITPKALTVTGLTATTRAYDGTVAAQLSGGTLNGLVGSETLVMSGGTGVFADKNAGTGKAVTVTGVGISDGTALASNYTVSDPTGVTGSITPKSLTVTGVSVAGKVYDGNTAASLSGGALDGLVGAETLALTGLSAVFDNQNAGNGKAVTVTGATLGDGTGGGLAANYMVSNPTGLTADITPKALTVTGLTATTRDYDGTVAAQLSGGTLNGLVGSETLVMSGGTGVFADKNAGTGKAVTVTGVGISDGTALASNYTVSDPTGVTGNITPKALTVKVNDSEKEQGLANPVFSASYSGLVSGDTLGAEVSGTLVFSTPATVDSAAGNYLVSASGQASNNYALNYVDGALQVNPRGNSVVNPTGALQSAVANVIANVAMAPLQGNMVHTETINSGEAGANASSNKPDGPDGVNAPVMQVAGNVIGNILPGLRLSVIDTGLRLPVEIPRGVHQDDSM